MSEAGIRVGGGMFGGESIPVMESVLRFVGQRQNVLLNNVANWNTPNFKARDLDEDGFREALGRAIEQRKTGASPLAIQTGSHVTRDSAGGLSFEAAQVASGAMRHDGNTVVIDQEQTKLLENAMTAQIFNRLLARKFRMLGSAISGRGTL